MNRLFPHPFTRARIVLTFWYSVLLCLILLLFSIVLFATQSHEFTRIVVERNFGNRPPHLITAEEVEYLRQQVVALRHSFVFDLIIIDSVILLLGGLLSYMLAGITLEPIQKTLEQQKEFTADASHELRTPLAALKTAAEVALRSKTNTKEQYKKVISQMYEESSRLTVLVNELLTLSRIDTESVKITFQSVSIQTVIQDVADEMLPLVMAKKQKLILHNEAPMFIKGDSNRLKQLLLILLDNAVKYTPERGKITITTQQKPTPRVLVIDTGVGIPINEQERVFYRFYQSNKARSNKGAGLGLAIAELIAKQHKAKIGIKSREKEGTTISVIFPR